MAHTAPATITLWRRVWNYPTTRIIAFLLLFLAITILLAIPISLETRFTLRTNTTVLLMVGSATEAVSAIVAFCIMVRFADRRTLASAGFAFRGLFTETSVGYLIGAAMISTAIGLMALFGVYHELGKSSIFHPLLPLALFLCGGAAEEVIFRGYVFQTLEARWGSRIALIFSSLLFGLAHIGNPGSHASIWQFLAGPTFICLEAGLPLCAGYMATRRLWLPIGLHWAWNFFEGPIYGSNVSGIPLSPLFRAQFRGPFLLTGGLFGPEASVITLVVGAVAGLMLLRVAVRAGQWKSGEQLVPAAALLQSESDLPPQPENDGK